MAVSKVELNGETLINLQPTTAVEADVAEGKVFFKADGTQAVGEATSSEPNLGSTYITDNGTYYASEFGYDGFDEVEVDVQSGGSSFAPEYVSFSNYQGSVLNLTGLDTSNMTDMSGMFFNCYNITSLDVSNFNISNVTYIDSMFSGCGALMSIDISNFNTSNVTGMSSMFNGCSSLTSLDVSNFDTSNVNYMSEMFKGCSSLTSLDLSNFNTSNVNSIGYYMFYGCSSLQTLDIRNFSFNNLSDSSEAESMFGSVPSTCVIYVNQAAYDFIAADFNDQNTMQLADLSMLQIV